MSQSAQLTRELAIGRAFHQQGQLAEAEEHYQAVLSADSTHAEALELLAVLALDRGELPKAASFAEAAIAQHPSNGEYLHLLGRIQLQQGQLETAASSLSRAISNGTPDRVAALLELASCEGRRKAWRDSLTAASAVLSVESDNSTARRLAGYACHALGQQADALMHFEKSLASDPNQPGVWHASAVIFLRGGNAMAAHQTAIKACELAPENIDYAYHRRLVAAKVVPDWHFNMLHDSARNAAFAQAIETLVKPEHLVLEIGTGTGFLAMLAARGNANAGGAQRVVTCEENVALARVAVDTIARNGLADRVRVVAKRSTDMAVGVDLPTKADVLISEVFSVQVVAEGVLPTLEDAKARLLKDGALIIPAAATVRGALVGGEALARKVRSGNVHGFDLSALNAFAPVIQYLQPGLKLDWLSDAHDLFSFDLATQARFPGEKRTIPIDAVAAGTCQGVVQWLRLDLTAGVTFENRPNNAGANASQHWAPVFYPFPEPLTVCVGQRIVLRVSHNRVALRVELAG